MVVKFSRLNGVLFSWTARLVLPVVVAGGIAGMIAPLWAAEDGRGEIQKLYAAAESASTIAEQNEILEKIEGIRDNELDAKLEGYLTKLEAWLLHQRGEAYAKKASEMNQRGDVDAGRSFDVKAMEDFDAAIKLAPKRWKSYHHRGVCYALMGKFEQALSDFSQTVRLRPEYANAWFNRGEIHYQLGKFSKAIADYTKAIEQQSDDAGYYTSRGHAYFQMREFEKALRDYDRAVSLDPRDSEYLVNRGEAFRRLGQWNQAADDFRQAINADGTCGGAYQGAAWLMATCPDPAFRNADLAVRAAEKAIKLDGKSDYIYLDTLAAALANDGKFNRAEAVVRKAIEAAPKENRAPLKQRLRRYQTQKPYRQSVQLTTRRPDQQPRTR